MIFNYPVAIFIGSLDSGAVLQKNICHGNSTTHGRPMQCRLLHVVPCIDVTTVLKQQNKNQLNEILLQIADQDSLKLIKWLHFSTNLK